jgi:hypothetical protein
LKEAHLIAGKYLVDLVLDRLARQDFSLKLSIEILLGRHVILFELNLGVRRLVIEMIVFFVRIVLLGNIDALVR